MLCKNVFGISFFRKDSMKVNMDKIHIYIYIYIWKDLRLKIIIIFLLSIFSNQRYLVVFHWSLSDNKFPQVSRTLLSILANITYCVVWIVSILLLISSSSNLFPSLVVPFQVH